MPPEHSLGSSLVGQVGFAILKFPHLTEWSIYLMLNYSYQREPEAVGLALKIILLELILAGTDVCV